MLQDTDAVETFNEACDVTRTIVNCRCDLVCTCDSVCSCDAVCTCDAQSGGGTTIIYFYPN